jgi:hypothetical protein
VILTSFSDRLAEFRARWDAHRQRRIDARDLKRAAQRARRIAAEERRTELRLLAELRRGIRRTARDIRAASTNLGLCYIRKQGRKQGTVSEISFSELVATPAAYYLRVRRMPHETNTMMLQEPYVLQDLSLAAHAPVTCTWTPETGFWLVVERTGLGGIPKFVEYSEVLPQLPKSAPALAFPLGLAANRKFKYADLAEIPHLLIAGQTGGGKSVMLHNIVSTIIQRTTPNLVRFVMIDLKGRVELGVYRNIPHLLEMDGIPAKIHGVEDIADVLQALQREAERRMQLFERESVRNVDRWNNLHTGPQHLPKIVVVVDEIANAMLVTKLRNKIEPVIANLGAQGRAPGIHLIVSTQHPTTDVVTSLLKANLPGRIAFSTVSISASVVILDSKAAWNVGPPGRFVFRSERRHQVIQGPFLSEGLVDDVIAAVVEGKATEALLPGGISELDIAAWCIEFEGGLFNIDHVYEQFRAQQITHREVRRLQAEILTTQKIIVVNDKHYRLRTGHHNSRVFVEVGASREAAPEGEHASH